MQVALLNASPRGRHSTSAQLLEWLREPFARYAEVHMMDASAPGLPEALLNILEGCDLWVFSTPLYMDALPSHLVELLQFLDKHIQRSKKSRVAAIVNCGFYEGEQARYALEVFEHWAKHMDFRWCGGLGVGAGAVTETLAESRAMEPVREAVLELGARISSGAEPEMLYTHAALPRLIYKIAGEQGWRRDIRRNGGRARDLDIRPEIELPSE